MEEEPLEQVQLQVQEQIRKKPCTLKECLEADQLRFQEYFEEHVHVHDYVEMRVHEQ